MASDAQPPTTANYQSLKDSGLPFIVANRPRGRVVFRRDPQASDAACVMVSRAT